LRLEIDTIIGKNKFKATVTINDRATGIRMKIIKARSELVKQAAIELLENWKPYLFITSTMERICNASRNRYSIKLTLFCKSLQSVGTWSK
jgi:hypothetical protein